jgi:hypothetical protein
MTCKCFISADVYHRAGLVGSRIRVREARLTMLAQTHLKVSMGGEFEISAYDKAGRMKRGKDGKPITTTVVLLPNLHGIERELERLRPEYYGRRQKVEVEESPSVPGDEIPRVRPQEIPELLASAIRYLQSRPRPGRARGCPRSRRRRRELRNRRPEGRDGDPWCIESPNGTDLERTAASN